MVCAAPEMSGQPESPEGWFSESLVTNTHKVIGWEIKTLKEGNTCVRSRTWGCGWSRVPSRSPEIQRACLWSSSGSLR